MKTSELKRLMADQRHSFEKAQQEEHARKVADGSYASTLRYRLSQMDDWRRHIEMGHAYGLKQAQRWIPLWREDPLPMDTPGFDAYDAALDQFQAYVTATAERWSTPQKFNGLAEHSEAAVDHSRQSTVEMIRDDADKRLFRAEELIKSKHCAEAFSELALATEAVGQADLYATFPQLPQLTTGLDTHRDAVEDLFIKKCLIRRKR